MSKTASQPEPVKQESAAELKDRPGIYATLNREHEEVLALLDQAIRATSLSKRSEYLEKVRVELLSHARAERATLYRALLEHPETEALARCHENEHEDIEQFLRRVLAASSEEEIRLDDLARLRALIAQHIDEEENQLFVRAGTVLADSDESRLDARFGELKEVERRKLESDGRGWAKGPVEVDALLGFHSLR